MPARRKVRCSVDVPRRVRHSHQNLQNTLMKRGKPTRKLDPVRDLKHRPCRGGLAARSVCRGGPPRPLFPVSADAFQSANHDASERLGMANAGSPDECFGDGSELDRNGRFGGPNSPMSADFDLFHDPVLTPAEAPIRLPSIASKRTI